MDVTLLLSLRKSFENYRIHKLFNFRGRFASVGIIKRFMVRIFMKNYFQVGLLILVTALASRDAHGQGSSSGSAQGDRSESIRVVLSKVHGLGTVDHNASAKSVSHKGVRMIALTRGDRYSQSSTGTFSITDQVSQLNFVLPSRVYALSVRESVCLDRLQGMRISSATTDKLELSFQGKKIGNGSYVVTQILGCGDVVTGQALPATPTPRATVVPTVRPTSTPTPRPTATPTPRATATPVR